MSVEPNSETVLNLNGAFENTRVNLEGEEVTPKTLKIPTLFLEDRSSDDFVGRLRNERVLVQDEVVLPNPSLKDRFDNVNGEVATLPFFRKNPLLERALVPNKSNGHTIENLMHEGGTSPKTVVVDIPSKFAFLGNANAYQQLYVDYLTKHDVDHLPTVIMYTDGFEMELDGRHTYEGFLFASNPAELIHAMDLGDKFAALEGKPSQFKPEGLAPRQREEYNASFDLEAWEKRTADTDQTLELIFDLINVQNGNYQWTQEHLLEILEARLEGDHPSDLDVRFPERRVTTILDAGTGYGRIGQALARVKGLHVLGVDVSDLMLAGAKERITKEGEGLRSGSDDETLSYPALKRLATKGVLPGDITYDDDEVQKRFLIAKGNLFTLHKDLHFLVQNWEEHFPGVDKYEFFGVSRTDPYAFRNPHDEFMEIGFDMALLNWNTVDHIGDVANLKLVLSKTLNVLAPGAPLVIETPNADNEPYASAIKAYHEAHPNTPYGTLQDPLPDGSGMYAPRYFPKKDELVALLKNVGYKIDNEKDVKEYVIKGEDEDPSIHEYFIVARKDKF